MRLAHVREPDHSLQINIMKGLHLALQLGLLLLTTSISMAPSKWNLPSLKPILHWLLDQYKKAAIVIAAVVTATVTAVTAAVVAAAATAAAATVAVPAAFAIAGLAILATLAIVGLAVPAALAMVGLAAPAALAIVGLAAPVTLAIVGFAAGEYLTRSSLQPSLMKRVQAPLLQ